MRKIKTVSITLSAEQAAIVLEALDMYSRVGCGQFDSVSRGVLRHWPWTKIPATATRGAESLLSAAKLLIFPELLHTNASFSICNPDVPAVFRQAYDIFAHVRRAIAMCEEPNPSFTSTAYDGALPVGGEPLPTVVVEPEE